MMSSEAIHRSIAEADDLEEIKDEEISVGDVFRSLLQHPAQVILRWNWKAALLGAILRGSFYFTVYKASKESWGVTLTAVMVELAFRFFTSGVSGALVQSFRRATPTWLATTIVTITLPVISHLVEYLTHYAQETFFRDVFAASVNNSRQKAFAVSVLVSVLSALFNIFIMQHGVLLVGAGRETKSLADDLRRLPVLIFKFMAFLPAKIIQLVSERNLLAAIGIFWSFGFTVGAILGIFRGKWSWAWTTALGAWAILLAATLLVAVTMWVFQLRRFKF